MVEVTFDSYQSWQLLQDTISEEKGTQGRDRYPFAFDRVIFQSTTHIPGYAIELRNKDPQSLETI